MNEPDSGCPAVVDAAFDQRLADALRDRAVGLAVQDQRIDGAADVVDGGIADELDRSQLGIDLDLADMAAVGKAADPDRLVALGRQRAAQIVRQIVALAGRARHLEYPDRAVGAFHGEHAGGEFDVVLGGFEHVGGDLLALARRSRPRPCR